MFVCYGAGMIPQARLVDGGYVGGGGEGRVQRASKHMLHGRSLNG